MIKMPEATERAERMAGVRYVEADYRRLQRLVPAAGADDQQSDEVAPLAASDRDHRPHVPRRTRGLPAAPGGSSAAAPVQRGCRGYLHLCPQREGCLF